MKLTNDSRMRYGLTLSQVQYIFNLFCKKKKLKAHANLFTFEDPDKLLEHFRACLQRTFYCDLTECKKAIIINFWRNFSNHAGGHISPIAGYFCSEEGEEQVLILDVAAHRIQPL